MKNRMRKWMQAVILGLFLAILVCPTILASLEHTPEGFEEKRELAKFPSQLNNRWVSKALNWYTDHAPFRSTLISAQTKASQSVNILYREQIHPVLSGIFKPNWYPSVSGRQASGTEAGYLAPLYDARVIYGRENWLYYNHDDSISFYQRTNLLSEDQMRRWMDIYVHLNDLCDAKGITLVVMIAPNKEQVYPEFMPSYYIQERDSREITFLKYMRKNSGVKFLYPLQALLDAKTQYEIYYRQDTHWNEIGGYVGATELYRILDLPIVPLEKIEIQETAKIGGDLSNFCGFASEYPDYMIKYRPERTVKRVCSEDETVEHYTCSAGNPADIVVIGDSFRSAMSPILSRDFRHSAIVHRSSLDEADVQTTVRKLGRGDILLLLAVERYDIQNVLAAEELCSMLQ